MPARLRIARETDAPEHAGLYVHLVWATWDRLPLVTDEIERDVYRYISGLCEQASCPVLAIGGMPDHVHLFVSLSNALSVADLMEKVKGASSRFVSDTLRPGGWFRWQGHYGAFMVSARDSQRLIAYIRGQKRHHAEGSLWSEAEETYGEIPPADRTPEQDANAAA